jgi:hypothetical protein
MKTADSIEDDSVTTLLWYHQHILSFKCTNAKSTIYDVGSLTLKIKIEKL